MGDSGAQTFGQAAKLHALKFSTNQETNFSLTNGTAETSIAEKITEKLNVKVRFNRLKRRMRSRSTNIL